MSDDAPTPDALDVTDLELTEVRESGLDPKLVLGIGALCALALAFALFQVVTGNLGLPTLGLLLGAVGGLYYVAKRIQGAEHGELAELRARMASSRSRTAASSIRVRGQLLDI